jgi:hypothetical protein
LCCCTSSSSSSGEVVTRGPLIAHIPIVIDHNPLPTRTSPDLPQRLAEILTKQFLQTPAFTPTTLPHQPDHKNRQTKQLICFESTFTSRPTSSGKHTIPCGTDRKQGRLWTKCNLFAGVSVSTERGLIAMCGTRNAQTEAGQEGSVGVSIRIRWISY